MTRIVPATRPRLSLAEVLNYADTSFPVTLVGLRGYYKNTMGKPGVNDYGIYDDAIFIVTPDRLVAFNANTDPSVARKHTAVLQPGLWVYKIGIHGLSKPKARQYAALVQAGPVTVDRIDEGPDTGWFGINIHRGSYRSTSSLGCQTIHPSQWDEFITTVRTAMQQHSCSVIYYNLAVL